LEAADAPGASVKDKAGAAAARIAPSPSLTFL
jgi:hypothetical protein